ncbi:MAG: hypothetical protein E7012_06990, partial [Alphaproteobacteria bacterium]|nr:hypothetical protein [Alphaproteobacteria bacterium]
EQDQQEQSGNGGEGSESEQDQQEQSGNGGEGSESEQDQQEQSGNGGEGSDGGQDQQEQSGNGGESSDGEQDKETGNDDDCYDNHDIWDKAIEKAKNKQKNTDNKDKSAGNYTDDGVERSISDDEQGDFEKKFLEANIQERMKQADQIRQSIENYKNQVLNSMRREATQSFGDVGKSQEVLNWKKILKKTIEDDEDRWSYRRSGASNDYMARVEELEDENKGETEVMLDVSGSVDNELLREFLRQLKPIVKDSKLKVGCFDTRLFDFREIKNNKDIDNFPIYGGGGTDLDLAVRAFSKKKEVNKIIFTDGYSDDMPEKDLKNVNVIWLIYNNDDFRPCCGKVVYVDAGQIRQNWRYSGRNRGR